ncbi:hypothetical protein V491_08522 [Pseudogymnoascus sp. VKM F-3775]|nr:hypothetical protein V491_08522 [Pseudogymnoascus sp. VKM F-3775]
MHPESLPGEPTPTLSTRRICPPPSSSGQPLDLEYDECDELPLTCCEMRRNDRLYGAVRQDEMIALHGEAWPGEKMDDGV